MDTYIKYIYISRNDQNDKLSREILHRCFSLQEPAHLLPISGLLWKTFLFENYLHEILHILMSKATLQS